MKKISILVVVLCSIMLTACTGGANEINQLNSLKALNSETDAVDNYNLSYTDEQEMIYSQVSDRTMLDLSTLSACSDNELQQVINYMDGVDAQLTGTAEGTIDIIDSCFTDYLLAEFEKTPYYWQRYQTIVRGIDAKSRSIIVDVKYKTIDYEKLVQIPSPLVYGEPDYEQKMQVRYERWLTILGGKYNNYSSLDWESAYDKFVKSYGEPEDIYKSQSNFSLTQNIYETGNQKAYVGTNDSEAEQSTGTMTVRYVLVPNYVLGINLGITCQHMYITDYKLDKDYTENKTLFTEEGYVTVTDSVYSLVLSYFQCLDESDYSGLYKLTTNFGNLDKYYEDMFTTSYRKHENFTISLFDITGTHIECGVTVSSKVRAIGSNMTFPSYSDRYYMELELVDGVLQVQNMVLLSRTIEGEPTINTDEANVSGFSASIDLDNDDKLAIEKLICDFGAVQLLGDTTSDDFGKVVDLSMTENDLNVFKTTMTSLSGIKKVTWISNYQQGTSNYASVKCKELFQAEDNSIVEAITSYDFILKGNIWYIYDYKVASSVKLDTTNLAINGCLCLVSSGKVEAYTSQVKGTASTSLDNVSDTSVVYDHKEYTPTEKSGSAEQGHAKIDGLSITNEELIDSFSRLAFTSGVVFDYDFFVELSALIMQVGNGTQYGIPHDYLVDMSVIYYNYVNNRYEPGEMTKEVEELTERLTPELKAWEDGVELVEAPITEDEEDLYADIDDDEYKEAVRYVTDALSSMRAVLERAAGGN